MWGFNHRIVLIGALLALAACKPSPREQWEQRQRQANAEKQALPALPRAETREYSSPGPGQPRVVPRDSPMLRLSLAEPRKVFSQSGPLPVELLYRDLPKGAFVVVSVVRDVEVQTGLGYGGPTGRVHSATLSGSGRQTIAWPQKMSCSNDTGCGDMGRRMGRYRFKAEVYDRPKAFDGMPDLYGPATLLGTSHSPAFTVGGPPDFAPLIDQMRRLIWEQSGYDFSWRDGFAGQLLTTSGVRKKAAGYCAEFAPPPPLTGTVTACAPRNTLAPEGLRLSKGEIRLKGGFRLPPGVPTPEKASKAASLFAEAPYRGRAAGRMMNGSVTPDDQPGWSTRPEQARTALNASVESLRYRPEARAWLALVRVDLSWPTSQQVAPGIFSHRGETTIVIVKVTDDDKVCRVDAKQVLDKDTYRTVDLTRTPTDCAGVVAG